MPRYCEAEGCKAVAGHYWRIGDKWAYLCSDCKLKVQLPYLTTPKLKAVGKVTPDVKPPSSRKQDDAGAARDAGAGEADTAEAADV